MSFLSQHLTLSRRAWQWSCTWRNWRVSSGHHLDAHRRQAWGQQTTVATPHRTTARIHTGMYSAAIHTGTHVQARACTHRGTCAQVRTQALYTTTQMHARTLFDANRSAKEKNSYRRTDALEYRQTCHQRPAGKLVLSRNRARTKGHLVIPAPPRTTGTR